MEIEVSRRHAVWIFLTAALLLLGSGLSPSKAYADVATDIIGVWRTVDASSEEGKAQGGIVFLDTGKGAMLAATFSADDAASLLLGLPENGVAEILFDYTVDNNTVSLTVTKFGNMETSNQAPWVWLASFDGARLRLDSTDGTGKWILLERA